MTKSIRLLFGLCITLSASAQDVPRPTEYVSHNTCKLCHNQTRHGTQWEIWKNSPHRRAYETLLAPESLEIAKQAKLKTSPSESKECLVCHVTAFDRATESRPKPLRILDGVQCESCHGPGYKHVEDGRKHWLDKDLSVDLAANIQRPNEKTCRQCHRRQSPTWDPKRYILSNGATTGFDFQQAFERIAHPLKEPFVQSKDEPKD